MLRNVYLQGELGDNFGRKFRMEASTPREIFQCIYANRPEFRKYLVDCLDKNVDLSMKCQGKDINQENLLYKLNDGDITLAIVPAGSKKAFKIIAAIVLFQFAPQLAGYTTTMTTTATGAVVTSTVGSATALTVIQGIAINLGMAGLAELMAPDPSVDEPTENSDYLYTGSDSVSNKYDPIPVLYGELRVPGKLVDFNVTNGIFLNPTNIQEADGDITVFDDSKFTRSGRGS